MTTRGINLGVLRLSAILLTRTAHKRTHTHTHAYRRKPICLCFFVCPGPRVWSCLWAVLCRAALKAFRFGIVSFVYTHIETAAALKYSAYGIGHTAPNVHTHTQSATLRSHYIKQNASFLLSAREILHNLE